MHKFLFSLLFTGLIAAPGLAQNRSIAPIVVDYESRSIPVRVSSADRGLDNLARLAFGAHGRYRLVASEYAFDIIFTAAGPAQVRVDVTRGGAAAPVASETVAGTNLRHAFLRAADLAVEKTNGAGLKGFFTARLAFIAERTGKKEVYVSDLFLGETKQVTSDRVSALAPRWSPDGTKILYTSYKSGAPDIFQIDFTANTRTTFVSFKGMNMSARFSPNGQQVAMILSGEGPQEIYISDAQGRQVTRKTRSGGAKASPAWSPDGGRLVFAMGETSAQLYVMSAAGGTPTRLATNFTYAAEPDWSRTNPNKIAFTVRVPGGGYQIAVYDFAQGKAAVVSAAPFDALMPSWLADGRHLVYTARGRTGATALHILDTETGKSTPITPMDLGAMEANVWTP